MASPGPAGAGGPQAVSAPTVIERLAGVRDQVRAAGADPATVRVVAVTKGFGPEALTAAHAAGLLEFGENYAQELLAKLPDAPCGARWHFLGAVQANKVGRLAPHVEMWHSLDSRSDIDVLARRSPGALVLVQVNLQAGNGRRGAPESEVADLVGFARGSGLEARGLMAVGARGAADREAREGFARVASLAGRLGLAELSMGMSDDFPLAVAEGATIIRLGRALFGHRPVGAGR